MIERFCEKLRTCSYLTESEAINVFMDKKLVSNQLDSRLSQVCKQSHGDTLNRFKQSFITLSGKEVNQSTNDKVDRFRAFINEKYKLALRFKQIIEQSMTNKVAFDNRRVKFLEKMADIEVFLAKEIRDN